jgi:hypothetical protein
MIKYGLLVAFLGHAALAQTTPEPLCPAGLGAGDQWHKNHILFQCTATGAMTLGCNTKADGSGAAVAIDTKFYDENFVYCCTREGESDISWVSYTVCACNDETLGELLPGESLETPERFTYSCNETGDGGLQKNLDPPTTCLIEGEYVSVDEEVSVDGDTVTVKCTITKDGVIEVVPVYCNVETESGEMVKIKLGSVKEIDGHYYKCEEGEGPDDKPGKPTVAPYDFPPCTYETEDGEFLTVEIGKTYHDATRETLYKCKIDPVKMTTGVEAIGCVANTAYGWLYGNTQLEVKGGGGDKYFCECTKEPKDDSSYATCKPRLFKKGKWSTYCPGPNGEPVSLWQKFNVAGVEFRCEMGPDDTLIARPKGCWSELTGWMSFGDIKDKGAGQVWACVKNGDDPGMYRFDDVQEDIYRSKEWSSYINGGGGGWQKKFNPPGPSVPTMSPPQFCPLGQYRLVDDGLCYHKPCGCPKEGDCLVC